jgi:hypothetical protein
VALPVPVEWDPPGRAAGRAAGEAGGEGKEGGEWVSTVKGHEGKRGMGDLEAAVLILRNGADFVCNSAVAHGGSGGSGSGGSGSGGSNSGGGGGGGGEGGGKEDQAAAAAAASSVVADRLFKEQCSFPYDQLIYHSRQHVVQAKHERYNIEFGPHGQEQRFPSIIDPHTGAPLVKPCDVGAGDFAERLAHYKEVVQAANYQGPAPSLDEETRKRAKKRGKKYFQTVAEGDCVSTVKAFADLPALGELHSALPGVLGEKAAGLFAEGNHYYESKCKINFHGDGERKKVICLCLGRTTVLEYHWRLPAQHAALDQLLAKRLELRHGDIYIMSEKATGYDWKFGKNQWPEPRLVHGASFDAALLAKFMDEKRKTHERKFGKRPSAGGGSAGD